MNSELDDKELMKLYKERAEKAENELEIERNKIKELEKRIEKCIKEKSFLKPKSASTDESSFNTFISSFIFMSLML